jgi:predicted P-loop ATPase
VDYFGAEDTPLNRKLGACFLLGAVKRVFWPGAKVDLMPILYGPQGIYKSTGLRKLVGDDLFTDAKWNPTHRAENEMTLAGCLVWEIPELEGFDRAEQNTIKAFISRTHDDVLLPYSREKQRRPRMSVLVGTTNVEQCLRDQTGSRRHPVISVGRIDLDAITRDRNQLWAEAMARGCFQGEDHWLPAELAQEQATVNAKHTQGDDVLHDKIEAWLAKAPVSRLADWADVADRDGKQTKVQTPRAEFCTADVVTALGLDHTKALDRGLTTRVGIALNALGYRSAARRGSSRTRFYRFADAALIETNWWAEPWPKPAQAA